MDLAAGTALPELKVTPDRLLPVRYAGASGDFNPVHVDDEFARAVGLPGRILHGLYSMALVARAVTEAAGGPAGLERLEVHFRGVGVPGEEITVSGRVTRAGDGVATVEAVAEQRGTAIIHHAEADVRLS